jgi:hypothetical protein
MALYVAVMGTALIVSLLGLAGLTLSRVEHRASAAGSNRLIARANAHSAIELALAAAYNATNWRTSFSSGVESPQVSIGASNAGTLSWVLTDSDGSLTNSDVLLRLTGIGWVGEAVQVSSIQVTPNVIEHGPQELRSMINATGNADDEVLPNKAWCQYLKPTLPTGAVGWWVTSVDLFLTRKISNKTFDVHLYQPLPSNWPSTTVIDHVTVNTDSFASTSGWQTIAFNGSYSLAPTDGICVAVTTTNSPAPIEIRYRGSGVTDTDSALIQGNPAWTSYATEKALRYRVHGIYTTAAPGVKPVEGTWTWDAAP